MDEKNKHIDYYELIPKYLSGNASDAEVKLLEDWVLSSPENKQQFKAFKKSWILSGIDGNGQNIDVEQEWEKVTGQLFSEGKVVPMKAKSGRRIGLFLRVAAAAVVLLVASIWIFNVINGDDFIEVVTQNQVQEDELPDGTEIALNQFSTLKYTPGENDQYRRVELKGDAFFEVERDTARPFVITTQDVQIEVLGTAFYVDAREDIDQVQVIVQEGSVAVSVKAEKIVLVAGEIGIYDKSEKTLVKNQNEDVNYMAWKTGMLYFDVIPLERVVFDLNRKFHAKISIGDEAIKQCPLDTTFDHQSLDAIIKIIESTFNIKAERKGEEIILTGSACE